MYFDYRRRVDFMPPSVRLGIYSFFLSPSLPFMWAFGWERFLTFPLLSPYELDPMRTSTYVASGNDSTVWLRLASMALVDGR